MDKDAFVKDVLYHAEAAADYREGEGGQWSIRDDEMVVEWWAEGAPIPVRFRVVLEEVS